MLQPPNEVQIDFITLATTYSVMSQQTRQDKLDLVLKHVKEYPDFPKPGVLFRDIFGVLGNAEAACALYDIIEADCETLRGKITAVCGLDSRGFLFAPQIARQLKVPFVPVRKKGKLPGKTASVQFQLEYGLDTFEVQTDVIAGGRVLIVDDLLATGGSIKAAGSLIEKLNGKVELCLVIMELTELNARSTIPYPVHSLLSF